MNIKVNETYKVKTRQKTVKEILVNYDMGNGIPCEVIIYTLKNGGERFESRDEFERWLARA